MKEIPSTARSLLGELATGSPQGLRRAFAGEMMKTITTILLWAVCALSVSVAQAVTDADLQDTWINVSPTNYTDNMLGNVRWETVTFSTNGLVTWQWQREDHAESHSGKYRLEGEAVAKPGYRQRFNVMIIPHTMAVRRSIVMKDVTVQIDNRFPDTWTVLKWRDLADNLMTFLREKHAKEGKPFAEEMKKTKRIQSSEAIGATQEKMTALPSPADVFVIAVSPHSKELKDYFTPDSLLEALPKLVLADVLLPVGGKIFWQSGVIVLKDKTVLFWRTCGDWFVAIDTATGTTFYAFEKKATPNKVSESNVAPAPQRQR